MFATMLNTAGQVAVLFIMIGVGFVCARTGMLTRRGGKQLTNILFWIVTPAVIVQSFQMEFDAGIMRNLGWSAIVSVIAHIVGITIASLLFIRYKGGSESVLKYSVVFGNNGYMGLPLAFAVAGSMGVVYVSATLVIFNIINFTYGIWLFQKHNSVKFEWKKLLLNPGMLGVVLGIPFFIFSFQLPTIIAQPLEMLASMNTPVAMIVCGSLLAACDFKGWYKDKGLWPALVARLIAVPAITLGILYLIGIPPEVRLPLTAAISCPTAIAATMFANMFGGDVKLASKLVAVSTLLSILTIPIFVALAK